MSDFIRAGETINRLALQYEDMVFASKVLTEIGSLEQHLTELRSQRDTYLAKAEDDRRTHAAFLAQCQETHRAFQEEDDARRLAAAAHAESVTLEAESILASAQQSAATIVQNATNDAVAAARSQDAAVEAAQAEIAQLHVVRDSLNTSIAELEGLQALAKAKYEEILLTIRNMSTPVL